MFFKSQVQLLSEQLAKAEARAEAAETALAEERRENRREIRHLASMWLRHNRSLPFPLTDREKSEAKADLEAQKNQPIPLTDVEVAMRDANRRDAAFHGISQEDADRDFHQRVLGRMVED